MYAGTSRITGCRPQELVPGDWCCSEAGNAIPADIRIIESLNHENRGSGTYRESPGKNKILPVPGSRIKG